MLNDYSFLTKSKPQTTTRDYSFLTRKTTGITSVPTTEKEIESSPFRKVRLPLNLGGGEYMTNDNGDLYLTPRSQDSLGGTLPGKERDHIVPVSLGGTSGVSNLQYLESKPSFWQRIGGVFGKEYSVQQSPNRQEGKVKVEEEASRKYKSGELSLAEARVMVAMENMKIQGLIPEKQTTWQNMGYGLKSSLKEVFVKAPVDFVKQMGDSIVGSLDFIHRTGLQVVSGVGTVVSPTVVSAFKFLGDEQLKDISYDDIWKNSFEQGAERMLDIGRPDEYFRAKVTQDTYVPNMLFMDEVTELAKKSDEKWKQGDTKGSWGDLGKIAAIKFMTDWANPFYVFAIKGFRYNPAKPRGKVLFQGSIKSNNTLIGKSKVTPKQAVLNLETKPQNIVEVIGKKTKGIKEPDVRVWVNMDKKGNINVDARNLGGDIINKKLIRNISDTPTGSNSVMSLPANLRPKTVKPIITKPIVTPATTAKVSSELQPLYNEASKYKSAEEFINKQGKIEVGYDWQYLDEMKQRNKEGLGVSRSDFNYLSSLEKEYRNKGISEDFYRAGEIKDGDIWLTPNEDGAIQYSKTGGTKVDKYKVLTENPLILRDNKKLEEVVGEFGNNSNFVNNPDLKQKAIEYAKNNGYDSVLIPDSFPDGYAGMESLIVWDKNKVKTIKELKDIWNKAQATQSTPTPTKPSIEPSFSRHYERIKEQYGFKDSVEFDRKTELVEKKKAFDYIQRSPEKALRIGYGYDEVPKGINQQVFRASLVASLNAQGKTVLAQEVAKIQSLKMTEAAQTLAFGRVDIGTEAGIIKNITQARLEKIGKGLGVKEPEKRVEQARQVIERQAKDASKKVSELQKGKNTAKQLKEIDDLISSIIC